MVSVCNARHARLLKNVNKHFHNFVGQNQQKNEKGMKSSKVWGSPDSMNFGSQDNRVIRGIVLIGD